MARAWGWLLAVIAGSGVGVAIGLAIADQALK